MCYNAENLVLRPTMSALGNIRTRTIALVVAVLALTAGLAGAVDWRPALVEMSDGTKYDGKIYFNEGKIRLHHADKKKFYWVKQEEIKVLETLVAKQWMEKRRCKGLKN